MIGNALPPRDPIPPPPTPPREPRWFKIFFHAPRAGWIPFTIAVASVDVMIHTTEVFDPFHDIVRWLETLAGGGDALCEIDMEGCFALLSVHSEPEPDRLRFTVWIDEEEVCPVCDLRLGRRELVGTFYRALLEVWEKPDPETFWLGWHYMEPTDVGRYEIRSEVVEAYLGEVPGEAGMRGRRSGPRP